METIYRVATVAGVEILRQRQLKDSVPDLRRVSERVEKYLFLLTQRAAIGKGKLSFKDGKAADMALRWTAVLQKLQDKWTIQSLHFSSNLLDNPVLNAAQQLGRILAVAAGVGGFLLGAVVMLLLRRSTKRMFEKSTLVSRSPLAPLKKGGITFSKSSNLSEDLGGSKVLDTSVTYRSPLAPPF
ncbi:hypothetical protein [Nostoc sp.]|uniref:hypothetical protein n=1 Tax=Nostoc sp. TaxID=1180 RepID=UPI002FF4FAB3